MWEMDGRSTSEIAKELGIKESSVRHTVSRARASLRNVLATLIVDKERGITALDALSITYKKAAELAEKSSRAALSLILVVAAFLGFHTITGSNTPAPVTTLAAPAVQEAPITTPAVAPTKIATTSVSTGPAREAQIESLRQQIGFAQVQLGAQVDLLTVINDLNVFGQNSVSPAQVAALKIVPTQGANGAN
jgi:hypothetical protein